MRRFQKILAASVLMLIPAAAASAQQDFQGGGTRRNRDQSGGFGQNNGDQQFGNRQGRQNRNQFGGDSNNGNSGSYGNNGGGRQRFNNYNDNAQPVEPTPAPVRPAAKPDAGAFVFVPPVASGPITFRSEPLPKEFALLMSKSIFSKNHLAVQPDAPKAPVFAQATVSALVLRGAMREDTHYIANIEDTGTSKKITWVSEGDLLTSNGARVTEITLDHIVVEKNGSRRLITLGVNLDAGERMAPASVAASAGPTASAANGAAPVNVTASTSGTTSEEDVAEMMRRRRLQEIGQ
jgi:hypothetical protein